VAAVDVELVVRFGQRVWTPDCRWHLGDLAWNLGRPAEGGQRRIGLWEQDGRVVACGWLSSPGALALLVDPRLAEDLVDQVTGWAVGVVGGPVSVGVLDTESWLTRPLLRRGLVLDLGGRFFVNMQRGLAELPPVPTLPAGVRLRPVEAGEVPARAGLHRAVRGPGLTDEVFAGLAGRWPYRREFDWVAVTPDGRLVASVLGWYDEVNRVGEFEPVSTLAEYRRQGLARALGLALLHTWRDAGAERALVYTRGDDGYPVPRQVYTALGFRPRGRVVHYRPPEPTT
jgi:GNAT superfamily N-acetyltransferase